MWELGLGERGHVYLRSLGTPLWGWRGGESLVLSRDGEVLGRKGGHCYLFGGSEGFSFLTGPDNA